MTSYAIRLKTSIGCTEECFLVRMLKNYRLLTLPMHDLTLENVQRYRRACTLVDHSRSIFFTLMGFYISILVA